MASNTSIAVITRNGPHADPDVSEDEDPRVPRHSLRDIPTQLPQRNKSRTGFASDFISVREPSHPGQQYPHSPDCRCSGTAIDHSKPLSAISPTGNHFETRQAGRQLRIRRQAINFDTFHPLDVVQEEDSCLSDVLAANNRLPSSTKEIQESHSNANILLDDLPSDYTTQIKRHLKGDFDWLVSCSEVPRAPNSDSSHDSDTCDEQDGCEARERTYGCNVLGQRRQSEQPSAGLGKTSDPSPTDRYILLATLLEEGTESSSEMEPAIVDDECPAVWEHSPGRSPLPLKMPDIVQAVESALHSPSLTFVSDRSCSYGNRSSSTGSFALSRIEDSLEELDRLEDELEALAILADPRPSFSNDHAPRRSPDHRHSPATSRSTKRASVAYVSSAPRPQSPSPKTSPSLRRSPTMNPSMDRQDALRTSPGAELRGRRSSRAETRAVSMARSKQRVTSSKASRAPIAEMGSESAIRRAKQSPDTRHTYHGGSRRSPVSSSRTGGSRSPCKPSFELPGEAISRQKRERHEAKLRAEEEEERRRREVKASPVKRATAGSLVPRDTIASRARQAKIQEEAAEKKAAEANKAKRIIHGSPPRSKTGPPAATAGQTRGRSVAAGDSASRATSASTLGSRAKRNSAMYGQDNPVERYERERRDREVMAKSAREIAAERSRAASREWAEKKRSREVASRRGMH